MGRSDAPREVLAAGTGAAITDTIFNPLENVKVRLQLEGQADRPSSARLYTSFVQCARRVTQEEGIVRGLWLPGLVATWIRAFASTGTRRRPPPSACTVTTATATATATATTTTTTTPTTAGVRIGLYPSMKSVLGTEGTAQSLPVMLMSGAATGCVGSAIASPTDLVRVRLQGEAGRVDRATGALVTGLRSGEWAVAKVAFNLTNYQPCRSTSGSSSIFLLFPVSPTSCPQAKRRAILARSTLS